MSRPSPLLVLLALAGPAHLAAQIYIVDAAGGAGSHFTDLPQAVAAVPDGSTLRVRAGNYSPFVLDGKGLSVVGEGAARIGASFSSPGPLIVRRTAPHQPVLLKGLQLLGGLIFWGVDSVEISQAAGPVGLESVDLLSFRRNC